MKKFFYILLLPIALLSCKKAVVTSDSPANNPVTPPVTTPTYNYTSDRAANLNVIYFVPTDIVPVANYQTRLSALLLWGQNWYGQQMSNNGYGFKTFGLYTDAVAKSVKIITINGAKSSSSYPYSGGNAAIQAEVNAYFAAHPADNTSQHTLIIIPRYSIGTDGTPSGGPFYGTGRWCYALDYEGMDISNLGKTDANGSRFSVWFGGMMHELGHGLNLFHNRQKVSEANDPNKGMALMWAGNGTLGISPTYLTATDCAILNSDQVFNAGTNTYYAPVNSAITAVHCAYSTTKQAIVLSGRFNNGGVPVTGIGYYNDPNVNNEGVGVNKDYNAITWESNPIGVDSFYVEMPIAELVYKGDGQPYELKVRMIHQNGTMVETDYTYTFSGGIPVINFGTRAQLSKTGWSITDYSSQNPDHLVANVIDGDIISYWHSNYATTPAATYPHYITVDMGSAKTAYGLALNLASTRPIKDFEIQYSLDGVNFTSAGNYTTGNTSGPSGTQYFAFPSQLMFRYFKVIAKTAWDGQQFAAIAELGLY